MFYLESAAGNLLDAQEHTVAMERAEGNGLEDKHVERAGEKIGGLAHEVPPSLNRRMLIALKEKVTIDISSRPLRSSAGQFRNPDVKSPFQDCGAVLQRWRCVSEVALLFE